MTREEAIRYACRIQGLVYRSIGDYTKPSDCFCHTLHGWTFAHAGETLDYIKTAVIERLVKDGHRLDEAMLAELGLKGADTGEES